MNFVLRSALGATAVIALALPAAAHSGKETQEKRVCKMFPESNLRFPIRDGIRDSGVSEKVFNQVLEAVERVYSPVFSKLGGRLKLVRDWRNPDVNAHAERPDSKTWIVHMYGGLARHPETTPDALLLVACHEVGHQIGGAPHYPGGDWASSEGQADYFATLKCMREVLRKFDNRKVLRGIQDQLDRDVKKRCEYLREQNQDDDPEDMAICARTHLAAAALGRVFTSSINSVREEKGLRSLQAPDISTPDESRIDRTIVDGYPDLQCRFDTYVNGAICGVSTDTPLNPDRPNEGVCLERPKSESLQRGLKQGEMSSIVDPHGARPACWYNQEEMERYSRDNGRRMRRNLRH